MAAKGDSGYRGLLHRRIEWKTLPVDGDVRITWEIHLCILEIITFFRPCQGLISFRSGISHPSVFLICFVLWILLVSISPQFYRPTLNKVSLPFYNFLFMIYGPCIRQHFSSTSFVLSCRYSFRFMLIFCTRQHCNPDKSCSVDFFKLLAL